tara:strand:+ start:341 stop:1039 length:699 start_codon:yes stop_codon:yes gene_type:complete
MNIAVIPARGGSKRIPRKNISDFCGKPMISWPIKVIKNSKMFDRIIISTDDEEISEIALAYGGEVPFIRPAEISDDFTGTTEVIAHAVHWMHENGLEPDAVCCIYPTSVFLKVPDLKKGLAALKSGRWQYSFSVTDYNSSIFRSFEKSSNGGVKMFFPKHYDKRSQDLPMALHDAAQFYWGRPEAWINNLKLFDNHSHPIFIPRWRVRDIDEVDDWKRAESLFKLYEDDLNG